MKPRMAGAPYLFGPFELSLPDGWTAELIDQVHELQPSDQGFAIHLSGYERTEDVTPDVLDDAAGHLFDAEGDRFTLPSGISGVSFDKPDDEGDLRYWLLGAGKSMIVVTLTCGAGTLARHSISAQLLIGSIRPAET